MKDSLKLFSNNKIVLFFAKHQFVAMITCAVFITTVLVSVSLSMYRNSGAIQLDLSRPGYVSVRAEASKSSVDFQNYSSSGEINQDSISEFQILFTKQSKKVKSVDAFGGDPLSPKSLGLGEDVKIEQ